MMKRALAGALAVASLCLPLLALAAEPADPTDDLVTADELRKTGEFESARALALHRSDLFTGIDSGVLIHSLPVLPLLNGRRILIQNELGRMGMTPLDLFPVAFLNAVEVYPDGALPRYGSDAPGGVIDLRLRREYTGGEVGFFYGRSGGKYGREDFHTYIIGSTGNERFQITAGAAYQETNFRAPRRHR